MGEPYDFGLSAKANTARTASCSDELKFILLCYYYYAIIAYISRRLCVNDDDVAQLKNLMHTDFWLFG